MDSRTLEWIIHDVSLTDAHSGTDEHWRHDLPEPPAGTTKHVHGPPNDKVTKPEKSSSDSSEDAKKKAPWRSVSGSTLIQSVKKMISKLRHHKSLSEVHLESASKNLCRIRVLIPSNVVCSHTNC